MRTRKKVVSRLWLVFDSKEDSMGKSSGNSAKITANEIRQSKESTHHCSVDANIGTKETELSLADKVVRRGRLGALEHLARVGLVVLGVVEGPDVARPEGVKKLGGAVPLFSLGVCRAERLEHKRLGLSQRHEAITVGVGKAEPALSHLQDEERPR
jgi:hypothetical protein